MLDGAYLIYDNEEKHIYIIVNTTLTEVVSVSVWECLLQNILQNHDDRSAFKIV